MARGSFRFKQFEICQPRSAMTLSTDAVILGAWCCFDGHTRVLDVGTGTGILSLMCAQRSEASVCAIEPDKDSFQDAIENFERSPWAERIEGLNLSLEDFFASTSARFSHIISNPPYFSSSLKCADKARSSARHNDSLPFEQLVELSSKLLEDAGRLSVIIPSSEKDRFMACALKYFSLERCCYVFSKPSMSPKRVMLSFGLGDKSQLKSENIVIETEISGEYSDEFIELTRDFYLKF